MALGYDTGAKIAPNRPPGIGNDLDVSLKRLTDIRGRLDGIGDILYGQRPPQVDVGTAAGPRQADAHTSRLRDIIEMIAYIESAVERVGEAL